MDREAKESVSAMSAIITRERPNSADAIALITELEAHLDPLYPAKSRHGYSVEKLLAQAVAFFVLRDNDTPAGCGGIQLFGTEYGELKRMYVRPQFRGLGYGKLLLNHLADLLAFFYNSAEGEDFLYGVAIKRDDCRGLEHSTDRPARLT